MPPMHVALCGETYSTNLGDGVIAESLAYLVRRCRADVDVQSIDLSGRLAEDRDGCPDTPRRRPRWAPPRLRRCVRQVRELRRTARAWLAPWQPPERPFDLVIIGGGQLLMDNDLWFPSRLAMWHRRLRPHARAFAIHACGVGSLWSPLGRWLCRGLLSADDVVSRTVRDERSRRVATIELGIPSDRIDVVPDPAVWAAEATAARRDTDSRRLGLGIMGPTDSIQGADPDLAGRLTENVLSRFWFETIARLDARGHEVMVFTNGAPEDQAFAARVVGELPGPLRSRVVLAARPTLPGQLVRTIAGCAGILAQRLHAMIIASSLEIPAVGVIWDGKVREFAAMSGHPERLLHPDSLSASYAVGLIEASLRSGVDAVRRAELRERAAAGVSRLLQLVATSSREAGTPA